MLRGGDKSVKSKKQYIQVAEGLLYCQGNLCKINVLK